jgi:hypothetical protein
VEVVRLWRVGVVFGSRFHPFSKLSWRFHFICPYSIADTICFINTRIVRRDLILPLNSNLDINPIFLNVIAESQSLYSAEINAPTDLTSRFIILLSFILNIVGH